MSLTSVVDDLIENVEIAYNNVAQNGSTQNSGPDARGGLASDMSDAIDEYYSSALVTTSVTMTVDKLDIPDTLAFPKTSNLFSGLVVPIPTNPEALTIKELSST